MISCMRLHRTHFQSQATTIEKTMESEVHNGKLNARVFRHVVLTAGITFCFSGLKSIAGLEDELKDVNEKLEVLKKEYYFPVSPIVLGQGGVYCALDDVWVEVASGFFILGNTAMFINNIYFHLEC
jgi:hypothetical protein